MQVHLEESNLRDLERPKTASGRKNEAKQDQAYATMEHAGAETESVEISGPTKRLPPQVRRQHRCHLTSQSLQVVVTESGDIEEEEIIVTPPIPSRMSQQDTDRFLLLDKRPLGLDGRPMTGMVEMGKRQGDSSLFPSSFSTDLLPSSQPAINGR
eukprot:713520-Hanusia_phi.AAC.1